MIIGSGMLARAFNYYQNNKNIVVFASGISNSQEIKKECFNREKALLIKTINNKDKIIIYFSTCCIYDNLVNNSKYTVHKLNMEKIIKKNCNKFYIFRLPQVVGKTKSSTLVNYLYKNIYNNKEINIYKNSTRNIISANDVFIISKYLIENNIYINEITNIATPYNISVLDIVFMMEKIMNKKANFKILNFGKVQSIEIDKIINLNIVKKIFCENYPFKVLSDFIFCHNV